jgi:uncharacterized protein (DUF885 family)
MGRKNSTSSTGDSPGSVPFPKIGQERTQAAVALQKELFEAYAQVSRAWLMRVRSEAALWSELATKLTATRSVPEILEAYTKCAQQQMKMTAEDGQHLLNDCQEITQKISKSLAA